MAAQILSSTAEIMLEQITDAIDCPNADKQYIQQAITEILAQYDIKPALVMSGNPDLAQKIKLFLSGKRLEGLAKSTLKGYGHELRLFSQYVPRATDEITTGDIRIYLSEFEHLKTSSLSKRLSVLKSMFGWLTAEKIIPNDVTKQIKPPKKEQRIQEYLNIGELEMVREACITPRERALMEVLYATGGRLSEIQKMSRGDIDYQSMSVSVIGKGDKQRIVYFSQKAIYHLKKYLMRRLDDNPALFVSIRKPHGRLSGRGIEHVIQVISDRSEVEKNVHPHIFRHTFATLLLQNGASLIAVQELLGHSDPKTTMTYVSITSEQKKQSYNQYFVQ